MDRDRTELKNLADAEPERFAALEIKWDRWAEKVNVLPPEEFERTRKAFNAKREKSVPRVGVDIAGKAFWFANHRTRRRDGVWEFNGKGWLDLDRGKAPDLAGNRVIRISGRFKADAPNGVLIAHGGDRMGLSVYLKDGRLAFAQTSDWKRSIVSSGPLDEGEHWFEAVRESDGTLFLRVDDEEAVSVESRPLKTNPGDSLQIGADTIKPVGDYESPNRFKGRLWDLEIDYGNSAG